MEQRLKTPTKVNPDKDLRVEFIETPILNDRQDTEDLYKDSIEELEEEQPNLGDASLYGYSQKELKKMIEEARQDDLEGKCIPWKKLASRINNNKILGE